ncbi:ubiquitin carboxyl-terminal hydrolase 43-like [Argonauta hians]
MDDRKLNPEEYTVDIYNPSQDTSNKSNKKTASHSKKPQRKSSFKNVKDFVSRIVMRQAQQSTSDSEHCTDNSSSSCSNNSSSAHSNSDDRYFLNFNSCDSASVPVAVRPIGDSGSYDSKYRDVVTIPSMSSVRSHYNNSSVSNHDVSSVMSAPETGTGSRYKQHNGGYYCESTIRPLVTPSSDSELSSRHSKFKMPVWSDKTPGTVGLSNHGNTCFMNSVLQCISNASFLSGYFVMGHYKEVLKNNKNNGKKSGSNGEVTDHLGILLRSLWSGQYNSDISLKFKTIVGMYNPQFKGFNQHDAQEFLLWLLDQVHEDLNIAIKRNKFNQQDKFPLGRRTIPSEISLSNQTLIYQLFRGQYQSSLTCLRCRRQSNTYDPYLCLSLPLPEKSNRAIYVIIVYLDPNITLKRIGILMKNTETFGDLRNSLLTLPPQYPAVPKSKHFLCQIEENGNCSSCSDSMLLSDVPESQDIYLFEMPGSESSDISHNSHDQQNRRFSYQTSSINILFVHVEQTNGKTVSGRGGRFCCPQIMSVNRDISYPDLQTKIFYSLGPALKDNLLNYSSSKWKSLMRLYVMNKDCQHNHLPSDVEMPLYMPVIDEALGVYDDDLEESPLRVIVVWEASIWDMITNHSCQLVAEHSSVSNVQMVQQKMGHTSLKDCFYLYTQEEELSGDAWRCPHCRYEQKGAIKLLRLWSLPEILVVHLKRFKQVKMHRNKVDILVDFPMWSLDLSKYLVNPDQWNQDSVDESLRDVYDLFGVCNHYGTMLGGHYTAFSKNPVDGSWYQFDDTQVKPISKKEVVTKAAYLLFYQHRRLFKQQTEELHNGAHWIYSLLRGEDYLDCPPEPAPPLKTATATNSTLYQQNSTSSSDSTYLYRSDSCERLEPSRYSSYSPSVNSLNGTVSSSSSSLTQRSATPHGRYSRASYHQQQSVRSAQEEYYSRGRSAAHEGHMYQRTSGQLPSSRPRTKLNKFATIARTENPNVYGSSSNNNSSSSYSSGSSSQLHRNNSKLISRSKTYDDIDYCSQYSSKLNYPALETEIAGSGNMEQRLLDPGLTGLTARDSSVCSKSLFISAEKPPPPPPPPAAALPRYSSSLQNHHQSLSNYNSNNSSSNYNSSSNSGSESHSKSYAKSNISQESEIQPVVEPVRYQPQFHLYKYRNQTAAFHKKKLQGPCLKESSV